MKMLFFNYYDYYLFLHLKLVTKTICKKRNARERKNVAFSESKQGNPRIYIIKPRRKFKFLLLKTEIEYTIKRKSWFGVGHFPP